MRPFLPHLCVALWILSQISLTLTAQAEVKHGSELVKGENCGIPAGAVLTESDESIIKEPAVITDKILGSVKTTHSEGVVKFVRCKFINPGFVPMSEGESASPGTDFYTVQRFGAGQVEMEDCEIYGGRSVAVLNVNKMTRCYIAGGNDLLRPPAGDSYYIEVRAEQLQMASPDSHSDVLQVTFGKNQTEETPLVANIHVVRCYFDARGRLGEDGQSLDGTNGAFQFGSFGPFTGVKGEVTDSFFEGGAYTMAGGGIGDLGEPVKFRNNRFGRNCKYGSFHPGYHQNHDVDETNVWADTGAEAKGKPGR
jgi:hypothetical protein